MRSVFLLLGEKRKDIDTWMKIKVMIGKTGKERLKRRITEFVPSSLKQLPQESKNYIQKYEIFSGAEGNRRNEKSK